MLDKRHSLLPGLEIAKASDCAHAEAESTIGADANHECFGVRAREVRKF
jgi:hypothetical protein